MTHETGYLNSTANFQGSLGQASLRGRLFEKQVLNYSGLNSIDTNRDLSIRGLSYSGQMTWTLHHHPRVRRNPFEVKRKEDTSGACWQLPPRNSCPATEAAMPPRTCRFGR